MLEYWKILICVLVFQRFVLADKNVPKHRDDRDLLADEIPACGVHGVCDCSHLFEVVCTGRNLTRLPTGIPRNTSYLYLNKNNITIVPTKWMLQFENLHVLDISSNQIKRSFRLPKYVSELDAGHNLIENVEDFFRNGCKNLNRVVLRSNKIKEIPEKMFQTGCTLLRSLSIDFNSITEVRNETLKGLTGVGEMRLGPNPIHHIDSGAFSDLCHSVHVLLVQYVPLPAIPRGLFNGCARLRQLYWVGGALETIQNGAFSGIKSLDTITLAFNHKLVELQQEAFGGISWIRFIYLSGLNITEVHEDLFKKVKIVSKVDLGYNRLTMLPDSLFSAEKDSITALILAHNKFTHLSKKFFQNLPYLMQLYLFGNKLTQLPSHVFGETNLQTLYIFDNNISEIQGRPFTTRGPFSPRLINLRDNPILKFSSDSLLDLAPNATVVLDCRLVTFPLKRVENITIKCVTSEEQLTINNIGNFAVYSFQLGGFFCDKHKLTCTACSVGSYGNSVLGLCNQCPSGGFYQDKVGSYPVKLNGIGCKVCNPGTFVINGSGTSPLSCKVCPEGTKREEIAGFRACNCLENHFRVDRFGKCFPCSKKGIKCGHDFASIVPGYYWKWDYENFKAYELFVINLNTRNNTYDRTSTVFNGPLPMAHKCTIPNNCVNNGTSLKGNCQDGYQGWLCSVCVKGYFQMFQLCHRCRSYWILLIEIMLLLFITVLFLWYVIISPFIRGSGVASMSRRRSGADVVMSRVKILIGFYQVVDSYWHLLELNVPSTSIQFFVSRIIEAMSFGLSLIFVSPGCYISWFRWNPYTQLWAFYGLLLSLTVIFLNGYCITRCVLKQRSGSVSNFSKVKSTCFKLLVFTFFVSYSEACSVVFQLYNCDKFYLDQNEAVAINLLHSNYNISCDTELYMLYRRVYCLPGWILICSFPLIMFLYLFKYSRKHRGKHCLISNSAYPGWLSFMCENFKSNCWYWEIVELGRKVLLTFLPLVFGWEGVNIILGLFASVIFLSLHVYMKPMKDSRDNFLQFLSLLFLIFNMLASAYTPEGKGNYVYVIVALMNIALLLFLTVEAVGKLFKVCKVVCLSMRSSVPSQKLIQDSTYSNDENDETVPLCKGREGRGADQEDKTHLIVKEETRYFQTGPYLSSSCHF